MTDPSSNRLEKNISKIMEAWSERTNIEVKAAHHLSDLALEASLPEYLKSLSDALSKTIDRTSKRIADDKIYSTLIGQKHGKDRAGSKHYTMEQLIQEYHILRQVICEELEKEAPLTILEREVIVGSIEQAVNDAASEYSRIMKTYQELMTNTLAHDLRTPVSAAKIAAQLIMRRPDDKNFHLEKAMQISLSMDRIDRMISNLLDISRIQAGEKVSHEFKACNLDKIVRVIAEEFNLAHEGKVVVESSGECIGSWYEDGLIRIIENLISNAIKYGLKNSPVTISVSQDTHFANVNVHNEGNPIPYEEKKILFQQFKRSKDVETKVGWGLGLAVVLSMVEAHGGTIEAQSDAQNGTSFVFKLPKTPKGTKDTEVNHK